MSKTQAATKKETLSGPIMVPLNKLIKDPENVRTTRSENGIEALADNIDAEGLLQNLVVRKVKGGKFAVTGGERRRTALSILVKRKKMKATDTVPCRLIDGAHTSASLSENIHRLAMHPADQFIAWAKMAEDGLTVSEIATRHGATALVVEQRLKLGRLSPTLLDALKADDIDVKTAAAFALTDDRKKQEEVFNALKERGYGLNAHTVKSALTGEEIPSSNKLAIFVGREAYEKAGGEIRTDLFDEDVYFKDHELLQRLAAEKLEQAAEQLKEKGWAWVECKFDIDYRAWDKMRKIHPHEIPLSSENQAEKERLEKRYKELEDAAENGNEQACEECDEIEAKLDALATKATAFKPKEKAISGGFLSLSHNGNYDLNIGYVRREDDPKLAEDKRKAAEAKAKLPAQLNKALRSDLAALRREIFQTEFLKNPVIARDLLAFHTIRETLTAGYQRTPFNLSAGEATSAACTSKNGDMGTFIGRKEKDKLISKLPLSCFEIEDDIKSFEAFYALSEKDKITLQAYAAARMLEPQLGDDPSLKPTIERAAQLMSIDVPQYWTPDASFFDRVTKKYMTVIASDVVSPSFAQRYSEGKKSSFANALGDAFNPKGKKTNNDDEAAAKRLKEWVPDCMAV